MWCRKLTENKTVVGGEKKGRERKRERQIRDLYLKARPQVPEHTGSLVTDWVEGDSDRCSVDSAGWAQDGVLDYLWCYCVFLSCLHRPAYDYQRYNGSIWQCGADRHHTHTWSFRSWFSSGSLCQLLLCVFWLESRHIYITDFCNQQKSVLTLEATCSHLSAWGLFYFLYMWKDIWIMSITVLYMKATLKLLWAASSNLSSKHHIRIIIINIITNIILLLLIRVKDTLTDVLYCEKWWAVKTWIWDECQELLKSKSWNSCYSFMTVKKTLELALHRNRVLKIHKT